MAGVCPQGSNGRSSKHLPVIVVGSHISAASARAASCRGRSQGATINSRSRLKYQIYLCSLKHYTGHTSCRSDTSFSGPGVYQIQFAALRISVAQTQRLIRVTTAPTISIVKTPQTAIQHLEDTSPSVRRNLAATGQPTLETYVSATLISTDATYAPTSRIVALSSTRRNTYDNTPDRKSTRLNSSHSGESRMPSSA